MENAKILKRIIEERRSVFPKDYTSAKISETVLNEVMSAAVLAPNHKKTKPWRFKVFRDEDKQQLGQELQEIYKNTIPTEKFLEKKYQDIGLKAAKANIIITIVCEFSPIVPEWEEIAATAMAVQNMYLTCTANRVGCYWSSPPLVNHLSKSLTIEENQKCLGLFYMGSLD